MSLIPPLFQHKLPFYLSQPAPCPYLPDRMERKLFTRLTGRRSDDQDINATLTGAGFRRSHDILYRPACSDCNACVPVRIPVHEFSLSRNQRRIARHNHDLHLVMAPPQATREAFDLFITYEKARHPDSEMAAMSWRDFHYMLSEGSVDTRLYQLRDRQDHLVGCIIVDHVGDGLSAVYSFFDATQDKRSLGTQLILSLIDAARQVALPYIYLGYWIAEAQKMSYKARFQPLQRLTAQGWAWMNQSGVEPPLPETEPRID